MPDHHLTLERPYQRGEDPLEIDDARVAARRVSRLRRTAEADFRDAVEAAASAESDYRQAISKAIVDLKAQQGVTSTEAQERARGDCFKELVKYRVAEGMVKAAEQRLRGIEGERSLLKSLVDYSAKIAHTLGDRAEPGATETHGGRQ